MGKNTGKKKTPSKGRSTALMRAERGTAPVHLAAKDAHLLDRALVEGQKLQDTLEDALVAYGRWLLVEVFGNDTAAALDPGTTNPVWLELVRRAGGPTLGVSRNLLSTALRVAANDKHITTSRGSGWTWVGSSSSFHCASHRGYARLHST